MLRSEPPVPVQGYQYGPRGCVAQGCSAPPFGIHQAPLPLEFPGGVVAAVRPSWVCGEFGFPRSHGAGVSCALLCPQLCFPALLKRRFGEVFRSIKSEVSMWQG